MIVGSACVGVDGASRGSFTQTSGPPYATGSGIRWYQTEGKSEIVSSASASLKELPLAAYARIHEALMPIENEASRRLDYLERTSSRTLTGKDESERQ
jgi:hypothetical protein